MEKTIKTQNINNRYRTGTVLKQTGDICTPKKGESIQNFCSRATRQIKNYLKFLY
jgi:hypothetical protein